VAPDALAKRPAAQTPQDDALDAGWNWPVSHCRHAVKPDVLV
jgi:hypothetical protein